MVTLGTAGAALPPVFKGAFAVRASDATADAPGRTLVIVQLAGGNDGLDTLVPYRDPVYQNLRPSLAVPESAVLPLDDEWGLHNSLASLRPLWDEGRLALVHAVGYPNPDYSHFKSMRIWQTGDPAGAVGDGWLGSYLDRLEAEEHDPFHGFNVGRSTPPELRSGGAPIPSVTDPSSYSLERLAPREAESRRRQTALLKLYEQFPKDTPYAALLETTAQDAVASSSVVQEAAGASTAADFPETPLGQGFQLLAQLIASGVNLRVAHVTLGGFDTHSGQVADHRALLQALGDALAAFYDEMRALGKERDVLTMTWSEFGRRVEENASGGTDHGAAGPLLLLGGAINGGFYGEPPALTDLTNGNLKYTVDFRSVYASVLEQWIGVPSEEILGGRFSQLNGLLT